MLKTDLLRCKHKRKDLHIPPPVLCVVTWMKAVTKVSSMLGQVFPEDILSEKTIPKENSWSSKKSRVDVTSMAYFHVNEGYPVVILSMSQSEE